MAAGCRGAALRARRPCHGCAPPSTYLFSFFLISMYFLLLLGARRRRDTSAAPSALVALPRHARVLRPHTSCETRRSISSKAAMGEGKGEVEPGWVCSGKIESLTNVFWVRSRQFGYAAEPQQSHSRALTCESACGRAGQRGEGAARLPRPPRPNDVAADPGQHTTLDQALAAAPSGPGGSRFDVALGASSRAPSPPGRHPAAPPPPERPAPGTPLRLACEHAPLSLSSDADARRSTHARNSTLANRQHVAAVFVSSG